LTSRGENLFVYGTLRRGFANEPAAPLHRSGQFLGRGKVRGRLYLIANYPGLVPAADGDRWVHGELYHLDSPETILDKLDKYEGCGPADPHPHQYRRETVPVLLDSGEWIDAITYVYVLPVHGKQEIPSGEFSAPAIFLRLAL
jgi:gamma-glutamylcyclotransferase (GGCT)/AIG2-like uncharacterized protein YtfP